MRSKDTILKKEIYDFVNGWKRDYGKVLCIFVLISVLLVSLLGGSCAHAFNKDRITDLYFVSCTGGGYSGNSFRMDEESLADKWCAKFSSDEAKQLIEAISGIQDTATDGQQLAFVIRISYIEDGVVNVIEKKGYDSFPDNWEHIVKLTNIVANGYAEVTDSRDIVTVDAEYLRDNFPALIDESVLSDDMSLDDVVTDLPITYMTLYDPDSRCLNVQSLITDYLFDYYKLRDNQLSDLSENPPSSTTEELNAFAEEKLDEISMSSSMHCVGTYNGLEYTIIRSDSIQEWLLESPNYEFYSYDGILECRKHIDFAESENIGPAGMIFVDSSGRFLILTDESSNYVRPFEIAFIVD